MTLFFFYQYNDTQFSCVFEKKTDKMFSCSSGFAIYYILVIGTDQLWYFIE